MGYIEMKQSPKQYFKPENTSQLSASSNMNFGRNFVRVSHSQSQEKVKNYNFTR